MTTLLLAALIGVLLFVFAGASAFALGELLLFTPDDSADAEWASPEEKKPRPVAGGQPKGD